MAARRFLFILEAIVAEGHKTLAKGQKSAFEVEEGQKGCKLAR